MNDSQRLLFDLGLQYYVAARLTVRAGLLPVPGNLFGHGVEMFLKGVLAGQRTLKQLRNRYGHDLCKLWRAFKHCCHDPSLARYDSTVAALDEFERIRYPDEMLKSGFTSQIPFQPSASPPVAVGFRLPHYGVSVSEIDHLVAEIARRGSVNPPAFAMMLGNDMAREALTFENPEAAIWRPDR